MTLPGAEAFFDYVNEREQVRLRKEAGLPFPWTDDEILRSYKFTNVHREHDRTSRELIERIYQPNFEERDPRAILMNCATYRYFGTWEFAAALGWYSYAGYDFNFVREFARTRREYGDPVFTGAYVITNMGISAPKEEVVVDRFLRSLHQKTPVIVKIAQMTRSWECVAEWLMEVPGFSGSGFMAKETLLDTTYTAFWSLVGCEEPLPDDWWDWTPVGPGARRGAARVAGLTDLEEIKRSKWKRHADASLEVIMELCRLQADLWNHESDLCPHDIQFALCEFDKYERVRLGQGRPRSRYRPKI